MNEPVRSRRTATRPRRWGQRLAIVALGGSLGLSACSINRATGRLQLTTVSESEEVQLGAQNDAEVVEAIGLYESEALTDMVERIGASLAAQSERPGLPWTFRVLDDPMVNAFALPGGYVYVTRGLLGHLSSEQELAAVLGHEIGHVTARHGVVQLRKSRVAAASVGMFRVIDPNLRHVGGIAANTAVLALLKHSRDDEYEADSLGVRYTERAGFEATATVGVLDLLMRVSQTEQSNSMPDWLSTHPDPGLRRDRVRSMTKGPIPGAEPEFLEQLDGMVYGEDPRDGFIVESTFVHPRKGFRIDLPSSWDAAHDGPQVLAGAEDESVFFILLPTEAESAEVALDEFFTEGSFERGEEWKGKVGGFDVATAGLSLSSSEGALMGLLAFIDYDDEVMAMMALGPAEQWEANSDTVAGCFASFRRAEPPLLQIEPMRIRVLELSNEGSLTQLYAQRPSTVELPALGLLNGIDPEQTLPAGTRVKWVEGLLPHPPGS